MDSVLISMLLVLLPLIGELSPKSHFLLEWYSFFLISKSRNSNKSSKETHNDYKIHKFSNKTHSYYKTYNLKNPTNTSTRPTDAPKLARISTSIPRLPTDTQTPKPGKKPCISTISDLLMGCRRTQRTASSKNNLGEGSLAGFWTITSQCLWLSNLFMRVLCCVRTWRWRAPISLYQIPRGFTSQT